MREDMHKVLTEPARRGGKRREKGFSRQLPGDLEQLPLRQSMKRAWKNRKERNAATKPLKRFFISRCGRLWNDVYSEVCEGNSLDSFTQWELRDNIDSMVETNVVMKRGKPYTTDGHRIWAGDLWVHPETGVLHRMPDDRLGGPWVWKTRFTQIAIDDSSKYVLVDGIWYLVTFARIPAPKPKERPVRDMVFQAVVIVGGCVHGKVRREWKANVYAASKRQLGKRALARLRREHADVVNEA